MHFQIINHTIRYDNFGLQSLIKTKSHINVEKMAKISFQKNIWTSTHLKNFPNTSLVDEIISEFSVIS